MKINEQQFTTRITLGNVSNTGRLWWLYLDASGFYQPSHGWIILTFKLDIDGDGLPEGFAEEARRNRGTKIDEPFIFPCADSGSAALQYAGTTNGLSENLTDTLTYLCAKHGLTWEEP